MAAAERIVADGGTVVMAAACEDGVPAGGAFARLLAGATTPAELVGAGGGPELDRWQAQVLGRVLARAEVHLHSAGLDERAIADALLVPAPDLDGAVATALDRLGPRARVAVIPEGPLTVATVALPCEARHNSLTPVSGIESQPVPDDPLFEFAVPEDLLREAVAQVKDPDVVADLEVMPGTGEGKPPPLIGILSSYGYAPLVLLTAAALVPGTFGNGINLIGPTSRRRSTCPTRRSARWPSSPRCRSCCGPCRWRCGPTGAAARWWRPWRCSSSPASAP